MMIELLARLDGIVIGPGLGRNGEFFEKYWKFLQNDVTEKILVFDADSLFYLTYFYNPEFNLLEFFKKLSQNKNQIILTPNQIEAARLLKKLEELNGVKNSKIDPKFIGKIFNFSTQIFNTETSNNSIYLDKPLEKIPDKISNTKFSNFLNLLKSTPNLTILLKGRTDIILTQNKIRLIGIKGNPKRCGGQGDILSGLAAVYAHSSKVKGMGIIDGVSLASVVCRILGNKAFGNYGFAVTANLMVKDLVELATEIGHGKYYELVWKKWDDDECDFDY